MKITNNFLKSLLAAVITTAASAAPITLLRGSGTVALRPDPANPGLVFLEDTQANELIYIITNNSNANMTITNIFDPVLRLLTRGADDVVVRNSLVLSDTNPCRGVTLVPRDVCAFSVLFDTADRGKDNNVDTSRWQITESVSVQYLTVKTDGVTPLRSVDLLNKNVVVTVTDPNASFTDAEAVPEPGALFMTFIGMMLVGLGLARKRCPAGAL